MSTVSEIDNAANEARRRRTERLFTWIGRADAYLNMLALGWVTPLLKIAAGEPAGHQLREFGRGLGLPLLGVLLFLFAWAQTAPLVNTSLGAVPGPAEVWEQVEVLYADHVREREKGEAFMQRQEDRNARWAAEGKEERIKWRDYTGAPTYLDQIWTSLVTVGFGFLLATLVAVPLGIVCGLSRAVNAGVNPLIQIFKPVSPLAWLPIVTMVVSAVYVGNSDMFPKSFVISAITVTLCSLWPTLINTAHGVASIDRDLMNVGRVLQLSWSKQVFKLVLPAAMPLIFTGLRLSLGVGWMVLIAAEMLAQNPGLGKFVWDEFQNGSSSSLARIMVAVFTIGIIGFLLDRLMLALQTMFTHSAMR
ncbi:ABC transporter permease [Minwuia thermotolerans]|uniref:ABC transporter permease n=1 Tax=Minwuia thermotolerans TaxID=2056226 RepID=UPI000D6DC399|nr:ABC transporter permease [Minwuia thermotolerans]